MTQRKAGGRCDVVMLIDAENGERNKRIAVVPFGPDIATTLAELAKLKPRIVFNLTEWVDGDRKLDHAIAGLLDVMKLPYTGTGPAGLQICRDKALSKYLVAAAGVDVPRSFT